jgi:hypothetical protein
VRGCYILSVTERLDVKPTKSKQQLPPPRVRREPPTIEEAAFAAVGLTDDLDQQADIAANLMGVSVDEAMPHVVKAAAAARAVASPARGTGQLTIRDRVVTVERTGVRRIVLPPRGTARVSLSQR